MFFSPRTLEKGLFLLCIMYISPTLAVPTFNSVGACYSNGTCKMCGVGFCRKILNGIFMGDKTNCSEEIRTNVIEESKKLYTSNQRVHKNNPDIFVRYLVYLLTTIGITLISAAFFHSVIWDYRITFREYRITLRHHEEPDEEIDDVDLACGICLTNKKVCAFVPCGHLLLCNACKRTILRSMQFPRCLLCNKEWTGIVRVYS